MEVLSYKADVVILDLGLPDMDGVDIIKKIRTWNSIPIIVVSARAEDQDKVEALDAGADDYLTKPFSLPQLRARVEAHLRREQRVPVYRFVSGRIHFDLQAKRVYVKEEELPLTKSEYQLCEMFARHPGLVYTRQQILEEIFGYDSDSSEAAVTEHIKNLRAKLAAFGASPVETVWGIGYRWNAEKA